MFKLMQIVFNRRLATSRCSRISKSKTFCTSNNYNHRLMIASNFSCHTQIKYKYRSNSKTSRNENRTEDLDDESDDENFEELEETGKKIVTVNIKSTRLDVVIKAGFGDEIDLIHSTTPHNPDMLVVTRILILKISNNNDMYQIKLARDKNLTIHRKAVEDDE
ncbi:uncharacterized protein LOC131670428 [Phymastichus coffea]|uniref:uncharacterized protein LOC131670428 n=1 Tax=Phymastichus coffea TaxID=108790 RepID=UPI00273AEFB3|nr:uncharacterized protein LOC131670428 [Phymastichus coffea]